MRSFRLRSTVLVFATVLLTGAAAGLLLDRGPRAPVPAARPVETPRDPKPRLEQVAGLLAWNDRSIELLREKKLDELKKNLKSSVDIAHGVVEYFLEAAGRGVFNQAQAKRQAMEALRIIRYDGDRYFWADTTDYQVLVLPFKPSEEGRNWENVTDAEGRQFAKELADRAAAEGEVYLNYRLRRGGDQQAVLKQGYARLFKAWNWVIGSSKFTDGIDREIAEAERAALADLRGLVYAGPSASDGLYVVDKAGRFVLNADAALAGQAAGQAAEADRLAYDKRGWTVVLPRRPAVAGPAAPAGAAPAGRPDPAVPALLAALAAALAAGAAAFAAASGLAGQLGRLGKAVGRLGPHPSAWKAPAKLPAELDGLVAGLAGLAGSLRPSVQPAPAHTGRPAEELALELGEAAAGARELAGRIESRKLSRQSGPSAETGSLERTRTLLLELQAAAGAEAETAGRLAKGAADLPARFEGLREKSSASGELAAALGEAVEAVREESIDSRESALSIKSGIDDMMEMSEVINDIAERINVLAINAAIEAAHAGDSGKGFMVIAEEIRRLADGTRQNSETISQSLTKLIGQLEDAAENAGKAGGGLERLSARMDEAAAARRGEVELIDAGALAGADLAQDLAGRAARLAALADGAAKALSALDAASADQRPAAGAEDEAVAAGLARLADRLRSSADKLRNDGLAARYPE